MTVEARLIKEVIPLLEAELKHIKTVSFYKGSEQNIQDIIEMKDFIEGKSYECPRDGNYFWQEFDFCVEKGKLDNMLWVFGHLSCDETKQEEFENE